MESHIDLPTIKTDEEYPLLLLAPYFELSDSSLITKTKFEMTRLLTEVMTYFEWFNWKKFNEITPHLILGKLPTFNQGQQIIDYIRNAKKGKLGLVVSVIEPFALTRFGVIPPSFWNKLNVPQHILVMSDFTADASVESIIETVLLMQATIKKGEHVYVHCKAGRSRSAMICSIYLCLFGDQAGLQLSGLSEDIDEDIKKIEAYLIKCRPQVGLMPEQRSKAAEVIKTMRKMQLSTVQVRETPKHDYKIHSSQSDNVRPNVKEMLNALLGSPQFKYEVIHFPAFMHMAYYALSNQASSLTKIAYTVINENSDSLRTKYIKDFFRSIYRGDDANWFVELVNEEGPIKRLKEIDDYSWHLFKNDEDKKERNMLCDEFVHDMYQYISEILSCSVKEIKDAVENIRVEQMLMSNSLN